MRTARRAAVLAALFALAACATAPIPPEPIAGYVCSAERVTPGGRLSVRADLAADGSGDWYRSWWITPGHRPGSRLQIAWDTLGPPSRRSGLSFHIATEARTGPVRLELRAAQGESYAPSALADSEAYYPAYLQRFGGRSLYETDRGLPWARVSALLAEPGELWLVLVRADGGVAFAERLDRAGFDIPQDAMDSARMELQARVADFRARCQPVGPAIIT